MPGLDGRLDRATWLDDTTWALDAQVILFHQGILAQFLRRQGFMGSLLGHGANLVQFWCACVANSVTLTQRETQPINWLRVLQLAVTSYNI